MKPLIINEFILQNIKKSHCRCGDCWNRSNCDVINKIIKIEESHKVYIIVARCEEFEERKT